MIDGELLAIKNKEEAELLAIAGVVGVGLRNRRIIVYVENRSVAPNIPVKVNDVPITVFETGKLYSLQHLISPLTIQAFAGSRTTKWRPAPGGVSIGSLDCTAGTLGIVVRDITTKEPLILSNNHVLAQDYGDMNKGVYGKPELQPGKYDSGTINDQIGTLERWKRVEYTGNVIDAALAKPDSASFVTDEVLDVGKVVGEVDAAEGMNVLKSGRTSGLNTSTIIDVNATVKVNGEGTVEFTDQIMTNFMADGGDSGSSLLTNVNGQNFLVGLLHAGSPTVTIHCKFANVKKLLNVEAIGSGGVTPPSIPGIPAGTVEFIGSISPLLMLGSVLVSNEWGKPFKPFKF